MSTQQSSSFVVLVTGGNRGIGYGIVRRAVKEYRNSYAYAQSNVPLKIYLTSRDESRGREAIKDIKEELKPEDLKLASIEYHQLDLSDDKSKDVVIKHLQSEDGGLDVLVNNAGRMMDGFDAQVVKETFELNYYNATDFNEKVLPILKPNGKIVTLASMLGQLSGYSQDIAQRFRAVESKKGADEMAKEYQEAVNENIDTLQKKGWKKAAYPVSKACIIAYARGKANELSKDGVTDKFIHCCCPGYVNTELTKGKGYKTIDQGAKTPVMMALQNLGGRSGLFYSDEKEVKW